MPLPRLFLAAYLLLLLGLLLHAGSRVVEVRRWQRWLVASTAAVCLVLVAASQYALWTPLGASFVEGVQGRHLLPVAVAALWACHARRWALQGERPFAVTVAAATAVSLLVAAWALVGHYFAG